MKIKLMSNDENEIIETYIFTHPEFNALKKIMDVMTEI